MSFVLGIDIGLDSHIVAKMPLPVEPNTKPTYEIQNNHSNQTEFPCQLEFKNALLECCDQVSAINSLNYEAIAKFTTAYFRDSVDIDKEGSINGVTLSKKNGQVYMTFKTEDFTKEVSIPAAFGLMILYEFSCANNAVTVSQNLFTTLTNPDWKAYLPTLNWIISVPPYFTNKDVSQLKACLSVFGLPNGSFVNRSIPLSLAACYDLWKADYTQDKMITRNFAVFDFGTTQSSIYLVNFKRHHMKIRCHLHSTEASLRNFELCLADCICKANPTHHELFSNRGNYLHAIELAKKYLPEFFKSKTTSIHIVDNTGFMQDGVVIEYDEEIDRKSFIEECKKNKCFDAFTSLFNLFIKVLTEYKIVVNRILPIGNIINMDEIREMINKLFTGHAVDKRLVIKNDYFTPLDTSRNEAIVKGTLLLYYLITTGQASIDPAFISLLFWPSPELEQMNTQNQKPGILKISYTHTDVANETCESNAFDMMIEELTQFVNEQVNAEGQSVRMNTERAQLLAELERVKRNYQAAKTALEMKEEEEKKREEEIKKEGEEEKKEGEEEKKEGEEEEKKEGEEGEEHEEQHETEEHEEQHEEQHKSDQLITLETEENGLEEIEKLIHSDKFMYTTPDAMNSLMERLQESDTRVRMVASDVAVTYEERPIPEPLEVEQPVVTEQPKKKKRGGCCKRKSDVIEMSPA